MKERLDEVYLTLDDLVTATTDGITVIKIFGRFICYIHHFCFAHDYHLAVMNLLYARQADSGEAEEESQNGEEAEKEIAEADVHALDAIEAESNDMKIQELISG